MGNNLADFQGRQRALGTGTVAINPFNETGPKLLLEDIGSV